MIDIQKETLKARNDQSYVPAYLASHQTAEMLVQWKMHRALDLMPIHHCPVCNMDYFPFCAEKNLALNPMSDLSNLKLRAYREEHISHQCFRCTMKSYDQLEDED